jgi:hypothetical protein
MVGTYYLTETCDLQTCRGLNQIFTNFICKLSGLLTLVTLSTTHLCPLNLVIFVDVLGEQCFTKNLGLSFTLLVLSVP